MEVEDVPEPTCGDDEVVLDVEACAICGTDIRIYYHGHKNVTPPFITGHEICGRIAEVGANVKGYQEGERVAVVTPVGCGRCDYCRRGFHNICTDFRAIGYHFSGGFAEKMAIPAEAVRQGNLLPVPDTLSSVEATLVEPLSCVINGQEYLNIAVGDTVVVMGAGPIGCMHAALARLQGAAKVIISEPSKERLAMAKKFDFDAYIDPTKEDIVKRIGEITGGLGADAVVVACSVKAAQEQSLKIARKRGRISFFGGLPKDDPVIAFDSNLLHYNELAVFGAFASYSYQYQRAMEILATGRLRGSDYVTHRYPLSRIGEALSTAQKGAGLKVAIEMS